MTKKEMLARIATLERIVVDYHWMSRRYIDGRQSYATGLFNDHVRILLKLGIKLNPTGDKTIWAKDAMGRNFDGLNPAEAIDGSMSAMGLWDHYSLGVKSRGIGGRW